MPQAERWRRAGDGDLDALTRLEREANLATLGHVFPPDRFPFPDDDVAARWALVLADPTAVVEVVGPDGGPLRALTAYDVGEGRASLRHLAVHPDAAGRGLGADGVERAVAAARAAGAAEVTLWCLAQNGRRSGCTHAWGGPAPVRRATRRGRRTRSRRRGRCGCAEARRAVLGWAACPTTPRPPCWRRPTSSTP